MTVKELKEKLNHVPDYYEVASKFPDYYEFSDGVSEVWYDEVELDFVERAKDKVYLYFS